MKTLLSTLLFMLALPVVATELVPFTEQQRQAMQIETAAIQATSTSTSANLPGKVVVPNAQLHVVTAPQRGLIETLLVAEGDVVRQGQALARIQSPALLELQSEYLEVHTRYQLAKSNYDRVRKLNKEGIIAERRFLETKAQYQEVLTALSRVKRMLELSGMDESFLARLREDRKVDSTLIVIAPFDGVILEQMTTAGKRVEAADPLYQIASLNPLWLEIHVPLVQIANIRPGQKVIVSSVNVSGTIITIGKKVHGTDQGVRVRAEIREGAEKLRPGQFIQVQLAIPSDQENYRVPRSAVTRTGGNSFIFAEQPGGFLPIQVRVLAEETDAVIIGAEIPTHTRVVVTGTAAIKAAWLGGE
ncbi:MAG TPA: efflux RND transporter periplasmic adaptor subunit [Gammaproteobacteria bacterium]|nr:efflux RND transporter periplasmic adaptor subunit [Gammaproteobacteria bacterium]